MKYADKGTEIGDLVERKNAKYGDSFSKAGDVLKIFFPNGVSVEQFSDLLAIVRILDKIFRIVTDKDAFGESPWQDIGGYAILKAVQDEEEKE